jgi:seryl-tRNA synthetase
MKSKFYVAAGILLWLNIGIAQTTPPEVTPKGIYTLNDELKKKVNTEVGRLNQSIASLTAEVQSLQKKKAQEKDEAMKDSLNTTIQELIVQRGAIIQKTRSVLLQYNNIVKDSLSFYVQRTPKGDFLLFSE